MVCARAGWAMGDILYKYLKHQKTCDRYRYVGRVLVGLNVFKATSLASFRHIFLIVMIEKMI